jgi:hypothetical protein
VSANLPRAGVLAPLARGLGLERAQLADGAGAFAALSRGFGRAMAREGGAEELRFELAGVAVRLRIAGPKLAAQLRCPFEHLAGGDSAGRPPALSIDLWSPAETGVAEPVAAPSVRSNPSGWEREFGAIAWSSDRRWIGVRRGALLTWHDRQAARIVGCGAAARADLYHRGKPLHLPLLIWHLDRGTPVIHAGLVARDREGVLLAGVGGAGKTSVALACRAAGFMFLGDDYIGLRRRGRAFVGHSVYGSTWLMAADLPLHPELAAHALRPRRPEREKSLILLHRLDPSRLGRSAPIRGLLLPKIVAARSATRPASSADALRQLAPTTMLRLPNAGAATFELLAELALRLPSAWLELGTDRDRIAELVDRCRIRWRARDPPSPSPGA